MAEQHRATAEQWALIERMRHHGGHPEFSAIIELLHRVEALEAAQGGSIDLSHLSEPGRERPATRLLSYKVGKAEPIENWGEGHTLVDPPATTAKPNHPAKPDSSLVGRVAAAITGDGDDPINWKPEARAAIREVAAWLRENPDVYFAPALVFVLEKEAELESLKPTQR